MLKYNTAKEWETLPTFRPRVQFPSPAPKCSQMMNEKAKLNLNFYKWEEIKKIFFNKKFENVILFSQPRFGSTFVSNLLSKELKYSANIFSEEFFINQHFVYLKSFIKKKNTLYLYPYRDSTEIINSYQKAKKLNYYLGWEEIINKYRRFFPEIEKTASTPLFSHKVWEQQIKKFDNAYTIAYESFKTHKFFLSSNIRDEKITKLKNIELVENTNIKKKFIDEMKGKIAYN